MTSIFTLLPKRDLCKMFNFEVCAYLFVFKEDEIFNHRNMLNILRIKI